LDELNKNNSKQPNNEEIEYFVPSEEDFVEDDSNIQNTNKERKILKKSKKMTELMEEEGLTEEEFEAKYSNDTKNVANNPYEYDNIYDYDEDLDRIEYEEEFRKENSIDDNQETEVNSENLENEEDDIEENVEDDEDIDINSEEIEEEDDEEEEKTSGKTADSGEFPEEITDLKLECMYIGLLLNQPKAISMYYFVYDECLFSDEELGNIYKIILFQDGEAFAPAIAKEKFKFPKENTGTYDFKMQLKNAVQNRNYSLEETYINLKKLFILKKFYRSAPTMNIQNKIVEIAKYERYSEMTIEEVESAIEQIGVTNRLSQAILNEGATEFLISGESNLTNGVPLPFPIISSIFKGLRKGETMAYAMPSNSGKSRFTVNMAAFLALAQKKKVLIISNEMSEDKIRLCLITTIVNSEHIQALHGQKLHITEGELLGLKFRPDPNVKDVEVTEEGYVLKHPDESNTEFSKRLAKVSTTFRKTVQVTEWLKKQVDDSIHFIHITEHSNDDLRKIILNYFYKYDIEYIFYDTLKTDTENIGNGEELKKTATILSNIAQKYHVFIGSSLQLLESSTLPVNLTINDMSASKTVKEVLDTLLLIKQINPHTYAKYEYSEDELAEEYKEIEPSKDPDVRYYACVVDKNRAGAKPTLLFKLNLAYNYWEEMGYLRLKQEFLDM
jgi:hypothetical protein